MLQRHPLSLWLAPALAALLAPHGRAQCAEWDSSFGGTGVGGPVHAALCFDQGSQNQALYVGGNFDWVSGQVAAGVACWDGSAWSPVGQELQGTVLALASYDDGSGPAVFAGGSFSLTGTQNHMAVWNGAQWVAFGPPSGAKEIVDFAVHDDGGGSVLYAAGNEPTGKGAVYAWDGLALTQIGSHPVRIESLGAHDSGTGPRLYAGIRPAGTMWQILQWQGGTTWTNWEFVQGGSQTPFELRTLDVGSGPELHVAGEFTSIGGFAAAGVASLDTFSWNPVGAGLTGTVHALTAHDDGSGPVLFAGGSLSASGGTSLQNLARFNGSAWAAAGQANGTVRVLAEDGAGSLFAGGDFDRLDGERVNHLARWDGIDWAPLGSGFGLDAGVRVFEAPLPPAPASTMR